MTTTISGGIRVLAEFNVRKTEGTATINAPFTVNTNHEITTVNTNVIWTVTGTIDISGTVTYDTQDESLTSIFGDAVKISKISSLVIINDSATANLTAELSDIRGAAADTIVLLGPGGTVALSLPTTPAGGGTLSGITLTGTLAGAYTMQATGKTT